MKKSKFLSIILAVFLLLPCFVIPAHAAMVEDSANWGNLTDSEASELLYSAWEGGRESFVFVYYRDTCGYSQQSVPLFVEYAKTNNMKIYGLNDNEYPDFTMWMKFFLGKGSVGFPVVIAYNYEKKFIHAEDSIRSKNEIQDFMEKAGFNTSLTGGKIEVNKGDSPFTDLFPGDRYFDEVSFLSEKGIISGYDDGSFKPDNTITRAEAAAIIVRAAGLGESTGKSIYADVQDNHWATKYIMSASDAGIINGTGDGCFAPMDNVTRMQIIKMIVCMMGLDDAAQASSGWPYGYAYVANRNGIIDNNTHILIFSGDYGDKPASRGEVAKLIYNAIDSKD